MVDTRDPRRDQPRLVKEGLRTFAKRERQKKIVKRQAQKIRRGGGIARVEEIGGKSVLIQVKQPDLFTIKGKKAKPDFRGIIRGFSRADLVKIRSQKQNRLKQLKKVGITRIVESFQPPRPTIRATGRVEKIPTQKVLGRIDVAPTNFLEKQRRRLQGVIQKQTGSESSSPSKAILAGLGTGVIGFTQGLVSGGKFVVSAITKPVKTFTDVREGLSELAKNPKGEINKLSQDLKINPLNVITNFLGFNVALGVAGKAVIKSPVGKVIAKENFLKSLTKNKRSDARKILSGFTDSRINNIIKEASKLPPKQSQAVISQLKALKNSNKLSEQALKGKEVGIVTSLDKQLISKSINQGLKGRVGRTDIVTLTKNKLFIVDKKNVPKVRTKPFDVDIITVSKSKTKGLEKIGARTETVTARFNPNTKKIEIISKGRKIKNLNPNEAFNMIQKLKTKAKEIEIIKRIDVKPSIRLVSSKKRIKITKKIEITKKGKVKKGFQIETLKNEIKVKGAVRKIKTTVAVSRKKRIKKEVGVFKKEELISLSQLKISPKTKKVRGKKLEGLIKKAKPKDILAIDVKTGTGFKLTMKQVSTLKQEFPKIVTQIKKVGKSINTQKNILFTPASLKAVSKSAQKDILLSLVKGKSIKKALSKIKVKPSIKLISVRKQIIKKSSIIKVKKKSRQKPSAKFKPVTKQLPVTKPQIKLSIKNIEVQVRKQKQKVLSRRRGLRIKSVFKPKPKKLFLIFKKKKKRSIRKRGSVKKVKFKQVFTPTIVRPEKKLKKEEELQLFTGLEFR